MLWNLFVFGLGTKAAQLKQHRSCGTHRAASVPSLRSLPHPGDGDQSHTVSQTTPASPPAFPGFGAGIPVPHNLGSAVRKKAAGSPPIRSAAPGSVSSAVGNYLRLHSKRKESSRTETAF